MSTKAVLLAGSVVVLSFALYKLKRTSSVAISRDTFISILREITESGFEVMFEYAQMAARVTVASSSNREPFKSDRSVKKSDPNLIAQLNAVQTKILNRHSLSVDQLVLAQAVYSDSEIESLAAVIPAMLDSYSQGEFPVLPSILWPSFSASDGELLSSISSALEAKRARLAELKTAMPSEMESLVSTGEVSIDTKNAIARRINESGEFRQKLMMTVMDAQNAVRASLD